MVFAHAFLMVSCWFNNSPRFNLKLFKYFITFIGMLWYSFLILSIANNNYFTNAPDRQPNVANAAIITWGRIELYAWFGIVISNILFMFMRSLKKNELDPTVYVDDNKKIPTIDTIVSMHEVASLFHTEFVPFFIGNC